MQARVQHIDYTRPWVADYQQRMLDCPARYTVTEASTKAGKTASHIIWLFEQALQGHEGQQFWWVAPVYGQAEIAFSRMKRQVSVPGFFIANQSKLTLTLPNGAIIAFKSADKPDNLYGDDVYAAVFDEYTRAKEAAWVALRSTLTATRGKCKFIGNVKGKKNWGWVLAQKAKAESASGGGSTYAYFKITAYDAAKAGILEYDEIEQARQDLPEHVFKELYLAEASDDGSNPFGISHLRGCVYPGGLALGPAVCYGIDLAKSVDYTVVVGLNAEGHICYLERWQADWPATKERIKRLPDSPTLIDGTGAGSPIVDDLQLVRRNTEGFIFTNASKQALMEGLATDFQARATGFPGGDWLQDELEAFEYTRSPTGKWLYSAPDGLHDDGVCAYALARKQFKNLTTHRRTYVVEAL